MVIRCLDVDSSFDAYCNGNKRLSGKKKSAQESLGKRTNRKHDLENLKFFLGIKEKDDGDNPMKHQVGDDDTLLK